MRAAERAESAGGQPGPGGRSTPGGERVQGGRKPPPCRLLAGLRFARSGGQNWLWKSWGGHSALPRTCRCAPGTELRKAGWEGRLCLTPSAPSSAPTHQGPRRSEGNGRTPKQSLSLLSERAGLWTVLGFAGRGWGRLRDSSPLREWGKGKAGLASGEDSQEEGVRGGRGRSLGTQRSRVASPQPSGPSPGVADSGEGPRPHTPEGILTSRCGHYCSHI